MKNLTGPLKKPMANRFRKIREALILTQKKLADQIGRKIQVIADIELERSLPTIPLIISLMRHFNISASWLLTGEGDMFNKEKEKELSQQEYFKRAFPHVPAEPDVIKMIEGMAVPVMKNALILKSLEIKEVYRPQIEGYEKEKNQGITG